MTLTERFMKLFRGLDRAHGVYEVDQKKKGKKLGGKARTVQEQVTTEHWTKHLDGHVGLGIIPITDDASCYFGAIDIDVYDDLSFERITKKITEMKLPLIPCTTKSGGWHLYIFFKEPTSASVVREKLMEWAVFLGYSGVEVFPKQVKLASKEDVGNWINVPYFDHEKTNRYALDGKIPLNLERFLDFAERMATTEKKILSIKIKIDEVFEDGPPCLQVLSMTGFPDGSKNHALFDLGVFLKKKYGDDFESKLEEVGQKYVTSPLPMREVQGVINSLNKKDYAYKCKEKPICDVCNRQICLTRKFGVGTSDDDPGVTLGVLTKIETIPPTWIIGVDGVRIELDSTQDLINQNKFMIHCVEKLHKWPNPVKRSVWRNIINEKLENMEVVEAPEDANEDAQFMFMVEQFFSKNLSDKKSDMLHNKGWRNNGMIYFRSASLINYLDRNARTRITTKKSWSILRNHGAEHAQFNIKSKCVRCWSIPVFQEAEDDEMDQTQFLEEM